MPQRLNSLEILIINVVYGVCRLLISSYRKLPTLLFCRGSSPLPSLFPNRGGESGVPSVGHYSPLLSVSSPSPMSTAIDSRRRPSLWSYISFTSSPRRRSVSLPTRNNANDPFEKANRHRRTNGSANGSAGVVDNFKGAWMTQSQRSRYLKTGGILAFVVLLLFFLAPSERSSVRDFVTGMSFR